MTDISYFEKAIDKKILEINTAYLAKVIGVEGDTARLQPLTMHKAAGGKAEQQSAVSAVIPPNIKCKAETITYSAGISITVLVPDELKPDDVVYVGVCDRDISNAKRGIIGESTARHHDINDGVILRFVR